MQYEIILEYSSTIFEKELNKVAERGGEVIPASVKLIQTKSDLCFFAVVEFRKEKTTKITL
jgi:hypothetical protein